MMTDVGEIDDMTKLPLFKIMYGPLQESAQMIIHVGPLECLPKDEDQSYTLKKHVMNLESKINNNSDSVIQHDQELLNMKSDLESKINENNDTIIQKVDECKEKVQELASKDIQHDQEFLNMKSDLESKINENNDTIVKKDEECKEKVQELTAKDIQHDNKLQALITKDSQHDNKLQELTKKDSELTNKLQGLTAKDSQHDQEIETIESDLESTKKTISKSEGGVECPLHMPKTLIIDGGCYMFVDQTKTFNDAKSYCQSKSGRLFEPRTIHTNKLVYDKGFEVLKNYMWVGIISKNGKSGPWKFATSGENVVQKMWLSGEPDQGGNEICVYYNNSWKTEKWRDTRCTTTCYFICEFV